MPLPSEKEVVNHKKKLEALLKKVNPDGSPKRKIDENLAKALMRDAVRKKWMYCPTKLSFMMLKRIPNDNLLEGRCKWVWQCNKCKEYFKSSDVQCDHIKGETKFTKWEQASEYASSILGVCHDDLQPLCLECHRTKSRAEYLGIDWTTEEGWRLAKLEQEYTKVVDSKAKGQRLFLESHKVVPEKNEELRKKQIRLIMFGEESIEIQSREVQP